MNGFTLTELAVVLVIVTLLIGGMLMPLAAQDDLRRTQETQKTLNDVRDALIGFAAAKGRLPCPAYFNNSGFTSSGQESFCDDPNPANACNRTISLQPLGRCSNPHDGFIPGATLGLSPIDSEGYVLDGWNNRIRYSISHMTDPSTTGPSTRYVFAGQQGMAQRQLANLAPDLRVCTTATTVDQGGTVNARCNSDDVTNVLTNSAAAVIHSSGKNTATGGAGADETHNPNPNAAIAADRLFISHPPTSVSAPNGEFDDIVIWLSPNILFNRMIAAGRLP